MKHGPSFVCFMSVAATCLSFFQSVSTHQGMYIILFLSWHLWKVTGCQKTSGNSHGGKLFRTRWCSAVMEQRKKSKSEWSSWGPGIAPCPASVLDHIFDIQTASTNNVTDFPAESSRLGIPNSGADFLPVSWATLACLSLKWGPLPTRLVGILHIACTARPRQSLWRQSWGLLPAPGRVLVLEQKLVFPPRCLNQQGLYDLKKKQKTHGPLTACIRWTRHVSDSFILSREFVGSWTRTRGFGAWEWFPLSGMAYHQSNPVCRLIRLKL